MVREKEFVAWVKESKGIVVVVVGVKEMLGGFRGSGSEGDVGDFGGCGSCGRDGGDISKRYLKVFLLFGKI